MPAPQLCLSEGLWVSVRESKKSSILWGNMKYDHIRKAQFLSRSNRFVANVLLDQHEISVHVKNTGRCRELLIPGAEVWLTETGTSGRKYQYDLVAVRKENGLLVNIDSQAPNKVASEWLRTQGFDQIIPEYRFGDSRIDFFMRRRDQQFLMEVKGCTLEVDGVGYFPDAPTERGVKHLRELIKARQAGYHAALVFVIQMDGVEEVRANTDIHPEFGAALEEAGKAGVKVICLPCHAEPDRLEAFSDLKCNELPFEAC